MSELFPLITVDVALFTLVGAELRVLLARRANAPFRDRWALPGGFLLPDQDTSLEEAAMRVLANKVGVRVRQLGQVVTVSGATRDPRGWSLSTVFSALLPFEEVPAVAGAKTAQIDWVDPAAHGLALAFDHVALLERALAALRDKVERKTLPLHLMPDRFTLTDVQQACEAILGRKLDKGSFRRQIKDDASLVELPGEYRTGPQRPARLYARSPSFHF